MNHVTHVSAFAKTPISGAANAKARQRLSSKPSNPRFGSNPFHFQSSTGLRFNLATWKQNLPFIAMASSIGLVILTKVTGGFKHFQWHWPPNPFLFSRKKINDVEQQGTPPQSNPETAVLNEAEQASRPESLTPPAAHANLEIAENTVPNTPPAKEPAQAQPTNDDSPADLARTRPVSFTEESVTTDADIRHNTPPISPQSEHSFEIIHFESPDPERHWPDESWEHRVISVPNSPFNLGSPIHSRPASTNPEHRHRTDSAPLAKL